MTLTPNCPICIGTGLISSWDDATGKIRVQCEDCIPETVQKECANHAKTIFCRTNSFVATLDECYDHPGFNELTDDEIYEIVKDVTEEVMEAKSGIYYQ